jgi:GntR family transcriptional regulator
MSNEDNINKNSVIPIYYQLLKLIERQIYDGKFVPGEMLPPEHDLAAKYGISRMTVRRAISELAQNDLVYTQKGIGTFIAKPKLENIVFEINNFQDEIRKSEMHPSTKLIDVKIVKADASLAKKLEIELGVRCLNIRVQLSADGEPLVYENKFVIYTKQKPILETELNDPSLSKLASAHCDDLPVISKRILHASLAMSEEAKHLGIAKGAPVFVVEQTIYSPDKKPIGWGTSVYRGDKYKLTSYTGWTQSGDADV